MSEDPRFALSGLDISDWPVTWGSALLRPRLSHCGLSALELGFMEEQLGAAVVDLVFIFGLSFLLITDGYRQEVGTIRPFTMYRPTNHVSSGTKPKIVLENRNHGIVGWRNNSPLHYV